MAKKRNRLLRVLLLFAVLGGLAAIGYFTGLTKDLSAEKIRVVVQDAGPWGILLYLALFAIGTAMQAPGMLFVAAAILAYGKTTGFFIAHAGAVLSVSVNYALGRSVGGDALDTFKERMKFRWIRALFEQLEPKLGIAPGGLKLEIMIETTQSLFDSDGRLNLPHLVRAGAGRCVAAHFGTYDYTASCDITAEHQGMTHPACDFARELMKVSYAQTGVWLSDGATNIMPVAPHRVAKDGRALTAEQERENLASVHGAWRLHFDQCMHSLYHAYYQGWDLHPAQLPTRYAAVYTFFLGALESGAERLENFISKAAQATLVGDVFDDAATGQGLLNFFLRGVNCGAITEEEALAIGITLEELRGKSFLTILENRKKV